MNIFEQVELLQSKVTYLEQQLKAKVEPISKTTPTSSFNDIIFNLRLELHWLYEVCNILGFTPKIIDVQKQFLFYNQPKFKCGICPNAKDCLIYKLYNQKIKNIKMNPNYQISDFRYKYKSIIENMKMYINQYCNGDKFTSEKNEFLQYKVFYKYIEEIMKI